MLISVNERLQAPVPPACKFPLSHFPSPGAAAGSTPCARCWTRVPTRMPPTATVCECVVVCVRSSVAGARDPRESEPAGGRQRCSFF